MATMIIEGRRVYVQTRFGEPCVGSLKALGAKWDAESRRWWVGSGKKDAVEAILKEHALDVRDPVQRAAKADQLEESGDPEAAKAVREAKEDVSGCRVFAKVNCKGRPWYVIAEQRDKQTGEPVRCRLTNLDGDPIFWADCQACELVRRYEGREVWDGRRYSGKTRTVYSTIGSLREFRDEQKQAKASGLPTCAACGKAGDNLVADLEDGLLKHPGCCDIEP